MPQISLDAVIVVLILLVAVFVVIRGLAMPRSFRKREEQREEQRKKAITQRSVKNPTQPQGPEEEK
jgi:flagellar biosynthesis/type III secretory pathway M-ring protein FliF/YscJ